MNIEELEKKLREHEARISALESISKMTPQKSSLEYEKQNNQSNQLDERVFHISSEGLRIIADFGSKLGKLKQIQYVLLYLYGNNVLNKRTVCMSRTVLESMRTVGFGVLPNINPYLRSVPTLIIVTTRKKKSANTYEITHNGIKVANELMREISANQGVVSEEPIILLHRSGAKKKRSPLSDEILNLISESFFSSPKTIKEIKVRLDEKGLFYERGIIDEKVRRAFLGKSLRRIRQDDAWAYIAK
ncbi:MAG: hypothetical protein WC483_04665 [Candidatus Paceibacterota bacterium]